MIPVPNAMSPFDGRSVLRLEKAPAPTIVAPVPPLRDLSVCATERDCAGMGVKFVPPPPSDEFLDLARGMFGEDFVLEWINGNWNTRRSDKEQKLSDQRQILLNAQSEKIQILPAPVCKVYTVDRPEEAKSVIYKGLDMQVRQFRDPLSLNYTVKDDTTAPASEFQIENPWFNYVTKVARCDGD